MYTLHYDLSSCSVSEINDIKVNIRFCDGVISDDPMYQSGDRLYADFVRKNNLDIAKNWIDKFLSSVVELPSMELVSF